MESNDDALGRSPRPVVRRAPVRVLVAEDDDDFRSLLATALRRDGYDVVDVSSGSDLVSTILHQRRDPVPALAISDERMPGLNGLGAFRAIRAAGLRMPLVLITAFGSDDLVDEAARTGATVLRKPFEIGDLRTLVRCLLEAPRSDSVLSCTACGALGDVSWLDEATGVVLCRDCHDLSEQLERGDA